MLTHRPCELSRLKPAAFATPSDTKPLTGSRKDTKSAALEKHCIICEERAFWCSSSEFEFEKGMLKIPSSHSNSNLPLNSPTPTKNSNSYLELISHLRQTVLRCSNAVFSCSLRRRRFCVGTKCRFRVWERGKSRRL